MNSGRVANRADERAQAQKELREAQEQFCGLVEQSISGVCVLQDNLICILQVVDSVMKGHKQWQKKG